MEILETTIENETSSTTSTIDVITTEDNRSSTTSTRDIVGFELFLAIASLGFFLQIKSKRRRMH